MKLKPKRWISLLLAIVLLVGCRSKDVDMENAIAKSEITILAKEDYKDTITENGTVVSENSTTIYPEVPGKIVEVNVEVGDIVEEGQIIGRIDDSDIRKQIDQSKISMSESSKARNQQIEAAKVNLNRQIRDRKEGINPNITGAEQQARQALDNWQKAQREYDNYKDSLDEGYNEELLGEVTTLTTLQDGLKDAQDALSDHNKEVSKMQREIAQKESELRDKELRYNEDISYLDSYQAKLDGLTNELSTKQSELSLHYAESIIESLPSSFITVESDDESPSDPIADELNAEINRLEGEIYELQTKIANAQSGQQEIELLRTEIKAKRDSLSQLQDNRSMLEKAIEDSYKALEMNRERQKAASINRTNQLTKLAETADEAQRAYEQSLKNLEVTEITTKDQIDDLRRNVRDVSSSSNALDSLNLSYLYEQLEDAIIRAPFSGTITDVNMVVGESPDGYVAKLETINRTLVHSTVSEYDINTVMSGMDVEITANSLGNDKVFRGKVESVYPTPDSGSPKSQQNPMGGSESSEITYKSVIAFKDTNLKDIHPGMNVRVGYIVEEEEGVLQVPSTAIVDKGEDKYIYIFDTEDSVTGVVKEIPVSIEKENEFQTVITSPDLSEGMYVINYPDLYSPDQELELIDDAVDTDEK